MGYERYDWTMTTREKAHALLDELSDAELDEIVKLIEVRHEEDEGPEMAELPEAWRRLPSGAPAPTGSPLSMRHGEAVS
jgi:hypothetical protein